MGVDAMSRERFVREHLLPLLTAEWAAASGCVVVAKKRFQRVLDIGTGTSIWAVDFADEYPEALVICVAISPIQPNPVPPNCEFQIGDAKWQWTWRPAFDLIHGRMLGVCFKDPTNVFKQAF
jgi:trans-aconitate methyltransferase